MTDQKVLFALAHPDDETIATGLDLIKHLAAARDVYVLTLTRGTASGVLAVLNGTVTSSVWGMPHDPVTEGYAPLDAAAFGAARIAETACALKVLASGSGRTITHLEAGLEDQAVTKAGVMAAIQAVYDQLCAPGEQLWLKTHTDALAPGGLPLENPDHTAAGQAVRQLAADESAVFGNVRFYGLPAHWGDAAFVAKHPSRSLPVAGTTQAAAVLDAYEAFRCWAPDALRFAIGHQSVASLFISAPENRYHQ